jgi:small basic protein
MIYAIIGLVFGIIGGILTPGFVPKVYAPYFSVALMAGLDTAFGGLRAAMEGDYDNVVFLSGFLVNIMLSVVISFACRRGGTPAGRQAGSRAPGTGVQVC